MSAYTPAGGVGTLSTGGILYDGSKVTLTGITDGTSNTIMVGEQSDHLRDSANASIAGPYGAITSQGPNGWAMGASSALTGPAYTGKIYNCTVTKYSINQNGMTNTAAAGTNDDTGANIPYSSRHSGGANFLFGDGTVRMLTSTMTLQMLQWLSTRSGGETVVFDS